MTIKFNQRLIIIICTFLLFVATDRCYAQTNTEKAKLIAAEALDEIDRGRVYEGIEKLEQATKLDPKNPDYYYEIAGAYYRLKEYDKSSQLLIELIKKANPKDYYYQFLYNSYVGLNKQKESQLILDEAQKLFPNSARINMEIGIQFLRSEQYELAIKKFEKGIACDPTFALNYYWAAVMYLNSKQGIDGLMYGEIFINLDRTNERSLTMGKSIYDFWKSNFNKIDENINSIVLLSNNSSLPDSFDIVYNHIIQNAIQGVDSISIASLLAIRINILDQFKMEQSPSKDLPPLIHFLQEIAEAGHLETYTYWLYQLAEPEMAQEWVQKNSNKWESFAQWYNEHQLELEIVSKK